jgi:hypothetical protein
MATKHEVKCWPKHFECIRTGEQRSTVRRNDRDYEVGDELVFREWMPEDETGTLGRYTGREQPVSITHVLEGGHPPLSDLLPHFTVVLSFRLHA